MNTSITAVAAALLIARLVIGLGLAVHGTEKLFGWFGGYGLQGTGGFFETLGYRPGQLFALAAGLGETGGGVLTALGLLGPLGPALIVMVMLVAIFTVHFSNGFQTAKNGWELPGLYAVGAVVFAFVGPGAFSLDALFGFSSLTRPELAGPCLLVAIVLAFVNIVIRRPQPAAQTQ
jgi:putative oxidoreductase